MHEEKSPISKVLKKFLPFCSPHFLAIEVTITFNHNPGSDHPAPQEPQVPHPGLLKFICQRIVSKFINYYVKFGSLLMEDKL